MQSYNCVHTGLWDDGLETAGGDLLMKTHLDGVAGEIAAVFQMRRSCGLKWKFQASGVGGSGGMEKDIGVLKGLGSVEKP